MTCDIVAYRDLGVIAYHWYCCNCQYAGPLNYTLDQYCTLCGHKRCGSHQTSKRTQEFVSPRIEAGREGIQYQGSSDDFSTPFRSTRPNESSRQYNKTSRAKDDVTSEILEKHHKTSQGAGEGYIYDFTTLSPIPTVYRPGSPSALWQSTEPESVQPDVTSTQTSAFVTDGRHHILKGDRYRIPLDGDKPDDVDEDEDRYDEASAKLQSNLSYGQANDRVYACPFFKKNPHRYRHTKSCRQPFTMPRLREHIIGKRCETEQKRRKASVRSRHGPHTISGSCIRQVHHPDPTEAITRPLSEEIIELHRGPRGEENAAQNEIIWTQWYSALFGKDEMMPSCYFEENDIVWSNDYCLLAGFRNELKEVFLRPVPEDYQREALIAHLKSVVEAELQWLSNDINNEGFEKARRALTFTFKNSDRTDRLSHRESQEISEYLYHPVIELTPPKIDPPILSWLGDDLDQIGRASGTDENAEASDGIAQINNPPSFLEQNMIPLPLGSSPVLNFGGTSFTRYNSQASLGTSSTAWSNQPDPLFTPTLPMQYGQTFFAQSDDLPFPHQDNLDTLHSVRPQLTTAALRSPLPQYKRDKHSKKEGRKTKLASHVAEKMVRQPANSHGVFRGDGLDPRDAPSYTNDPEPPLSAQFGTHESLFYSAE